MKNMMMMMLMMIKMMESEFERININSKQKRAHNIAFLLSAPVANPNAFLPCSFAPPHAVPRDEKEG